MSGYERKSTSTGDSLTDVRIHTNPQALHLHIGLPRASNLGTGGLLHAGAALEFAVLHENRVVH
jgi:hypothetical protein